MAFRGRAMVWVPCILAASAGQVVAAGSTSKNVVDLLAANLTDDDLLNGATIVRMVGKVHVAHNGFGAASGAGLVGIYVAPATSAVGTDSNGVHPDPLTELADWLYWGIGYPGFHFGEVTTEDYNSPDSWEFDVKGRRKLAEGQRLFGVLQAVDISIVFRAHVRVLVALG